MKCMKHGNSMQWKKDEENQQGNWEPWSGMSWNLVREGN
jgi:hypothetical protein